MALKLQTHSQIYRLACKRGSQVAQLCGHYKYCKCEVTKTLALTQICSSPSLQGVEIVGLGVEMGGFRDQEVETGRFRYM